MNILKNPFILFLFILIFIDIFFILRFSFFHPPQGWDTYAYHLPLSSRILTEKGIPSYKNFNTFPFKANFFFPKNIEFLFSYYFLFANTLKGISVIHLLFLFFGVISLYSILRKFNIETEKAIFSFILFFIPVVIQQSITGYVDIETSSLFIIFLNFLINKDNFSKFLSLISISTGAGTKYSLFLVFLLFLAYLFIHYLKNKKYLYLFFSLLFSFFSSFHYYIFNYIYTKNFLYPFEIKFWKFLIFKGEISVSETYPILFNFNIFEISKRLFEFSKGEVNFYIYDNRFGGFGPIFAATFFFFPILILFFIALKEKNFLLLKIFLFFFIFYLTTPYKWWTRFVIFLIFISIFSYIYLWDKFKQKGIHIFLNFVSVFSLIFSLNNIICPNPYFYLNDYKGNPYKWWLREDISKSFFKIYNYIKENDTLYIYKNGKEENFKIAYRVVGVILERSLFIRIEKIEEVKNHYKKIISSPDIFFDNYNLIYKDRNIAFWVRK